MITPPSDADLERLLVETQKRSPGRVDIDRDELLVVISLLRDARLWVLALRVKAGDRELAPPHVNCRCHECFVQLTAERDAARAEAEQLRARGSVSMDALIREADCQRRDLAAALAERDDAHKLADLWRTANQSALAECERLQSALDVAEAETAERIAKLLDGFVKICGVPIRADAYRHSAERIRDGAWRKP